MFWNNRVELLFINTIFCFAMFSHITFLCITGFNINKTMLLTSGRWIVNIHFKCFCYYLLVSTCWNEMSLALYYAETTFRLKVQLIGGLLVIYVICALHTTVGINLLEVIELCQSHYTHQSRYWNWSYSKTKKTLFEYFLLNGNLNIVVTGRLGWLHSSNRQLDSWKSV